MVGVAEGSPVVDQRAGAERLEERSAVVAVLHAAHPAPTALVPAGTPRLLGAPLAGRGTTARPGVGGLPYWVGAVPERPGPYRSVGAL